MNADDFRYYMLSFPFLRYLSDQQLVAIEKEIAEARNKHNKFLKELGLPLLP